MLQVFRQEGGNTHPMERLGVKMEFSQKQRTWLKGVIFLFTAAASVAVLSSDCNAQLFRRHRARQWAAAPNYVEPQLNAGVSSSSMVVGGVPGALL